MFGSIAAVRTLIVAIFVLMAGAGCVTTLVSYRLEIAGTPAMIIGLAGTAYFVGLMIGSVRVVPVIRTAGHIRTFSAAVSLLAASTLTYSIAQHVALWTVLRLIDGICVASVFVCLESWLNDRAEPGQRGTVFAAYMIALYSGQALGQFLLGLDSQPGLPFVVAAIFISLAVLPVALTRMVSPVLAEHSPFSLRRLYVISPLGVVGVGATGILLGAFYALGVVYARRMGMSSATAALFMSVVIGGGVALQWPLGWLSDRFDRRKVIIGTLAGTTATCAALVVAGHVSPSILMVLGMLFGGLVFALYPLCVGHTNDRLASDERIGASSGLILIYSAGAAIGPLSGSITVQAFGPGGLFAWLGTCAGLALIFGLWRQVQREAVPEEQQQPYQVLPRTTSIGAAVGMEDATDTAS